MELTGRALRRIKELKSRQGAAGRACLRVGLAGGRAFLKWELAGPREEDLALKKPGLLVVLEGRAYLRLAEYALDFEPGARGFFLRRRARLPANGTGG